MSDPARVWNHLPPSEPLRLAFGVDGISNRVVPRKRYCRAGQPINVIVFVRANAIAVEFIRRVLDLLLKFGAAIKWLEKDGRVI